MRAALLPSLLAAQLTREILGGAAGGEVARLPGAGGTVQVLPGDA